MTTHIDNKQNVAIISSDYHEYRFVNNNSFINLMLFFLMFSDFAC